tara:strand:- start:199 stop:528 length:330 start_codon:yes stop_codon:yes gene_type:complete
LFLSYFSSLGWCAELPLNGAFNKGGTMSKSSSADRNLHWQKTKVLTAVTLMIWFFFSFEIHTWSGALNTAGFPGAYFMAGMGSQVSFAILVFWFARRQDMIDAEHGVSE